MYKRQIYWSGTGNTEAMANAVAEGMKEAGAEVTMLTPDQVQAGELGGYGAIAFGCPAMGSEVLEEMDFQPMFDACKNMLSGKRVALFGSFGWGDGQWMRDWEKMCIRDRNRPVRMRPASSMRFSVSRMPAAPQSKLWLLASIRKSKPA